MRFIQANIAGFGKLQSRTFEFGLGLNVIYAPNESGKSTLMSFLLAALYGVDRTKSKTQMSELERFRPWLAPDYRGSLKYELDDKQTFEVFRDFDANRLTVADSNGADITSSFAIDNGSKERVFAENHIGLTKSNFSNTIFIGHGSSNQLKETTGIVDCLQLTAAAGAETEHSSAKEAINKLEIAWRNMGQRESAQNTPLGKAATRVEGLRAELNLTNDKYEKLAEDLNRAQSLRKKLSELNASLYELKYAKNRAEKEEIVRFLARVEEIENEKRQITEQLSEIPPVPPETIEAFSRLEDEHQKPIEQTVEWLSNETALPELEPTRELVKQNKSSAAIMESAAGGADIGKITAAIAALAALIGGFIGPAWWFAVSAVFVSAAVIAHNYSKKRKTEAKNLLDKASEDAHKLAELEERVQSANEKLQELYARTKVNDLDSLNNLASRYKRINDFDKRIAELDKQLESLGTKDSFNTKKSDLQRLSQALTEAEQRNPKIVDTTPITRGDAESRIEGITREIENCNAELNEIKGRESEVLGNCRNPGDIEADLEQAKENLADTKERIQALELAKTLVDDLSKDVHARYASALAGEMNQSVRSITDSNYDEVRFEDDLQINVRIPDIGGQWKPVDCLSWGTREQFYVLLKIALAQYLSSSGETLPLLLDDAFTQSDDDRMDRMSTFLAELAHTHQILLFTCHSTHADAVISAAGENAVKINL